MDAGPAPSERFAGRPGPRPAPSASNSLCGATMDAGPAPSERDPADGRALLQHHRAGGRRGPLPHSAARAARSRRGPAPHRHEALLRAARAAPDREDLGAARPARPAQRAGRLPLRVHERGARADGTGRRGRGDHHRRKRLQHQGRVAAAGRLRRGRYARPARPAHRGDRAGVHGGRARRGVGPVPGPAVAGQRAGLPGLLQEQGRPGPLARHRRRGGHGRPGGARPGPPDSPAQARRPAPGGAGAAGDRAGAERRRRRQGRPRRCGVRPGPRAC